MWTGRELVQALPLGQREATVKIDAGDEDCVASIARTPPPIPT
jgi:hypothetical protein